MESAYLNTTVVGHVVDVGQLDRLQLVDERVRLRLRLSEVREAARLVDGDRHEVFDQVRSFCQLSPLLSLA